MWTVKQGTTTQSEGTMKATQDRLMGGWLKETERRVIRKQSKIRLYWSDALKRWVTIP